MTARVGAIVSLLAGTAMAGMLGYVAMNPRAFTTDVAVPAVAPAPVVDTSTLVEPGDPQTIVIDEVMIQAKPPQSKQKSDKEELPIATEPCSDWRDLGPKASDAMSGQHRVRLLCI